jgi:crossover junction endodeoxyribonuclease RuvC
MFDQVILGIDPGTGAVGLASVTGNASAASVTWSTTLRTQPSVPAAARLGQIYRAVREAIDAQGPAAVALERLMWGKNIGSAMEVARASGAVMVAAAEAGVPVEEYAPLEVKMAVTGVGNASKDQVRRGLTLLLGPDGVPEEPDAADAVAVALCHLQQSRMRTLARGVRGLNQRGEAERSPRARLRG